MAKPKVHLQNDFEFSACGRRGVEGGSRALVHRPAGKFVTVNLAEIYERAKAHFNRGAPPNLAEY